MGRAGFWILGAILAVVGLVLLAGGAMLIGLGGSFYYVLAGLLTLATAIALFRRSGVALRFYGALLVGTFVWSLWEVGLDGWALAPRLLGPAVLGLFLLVLPAHQFAAPPSKWWTGGPVLASFAAVALAGAVAVLPEMMDGPSPAVAAEASDSDATDWRNWGNQAGGSRHVPADQINTQNVSELELAWRYDADLPYPLYPNFEVTPLADDGKLYACVKAGAVVALDQTTGWEIWRYVTPDLDKFDFMRVFGAKCRGVSFYEAPQPQEACSKRIIFATPDGYLRAVDAADGKPCANFGEAGAVDLQAGMAGQVPEDRFKVEAIPSSPAAIVNGVAVVGQTVSDLASLDAPSGVIRGYDALTGEQLWAWNAGMEADGDAGEHARATPNAWGPLSGDETLGLVFVPLGNSPPDYYGGSRPEELDRFTTAVVALDAATGAMRWSFQTVHHDLWDYDLAAQPVAVDLPGEGGAMPALLVPTKLGQLFVLDRRTGEPIDPVAEKPVPQGGVPGERTAKTQPVTTGFPSLSGPDLSERDMWGMTPLDQMWCRIRFRQAEYKGQFTPVTTRDTIMFPGTAGGINWGSVSIDEARGLIVVNTLRFANFGRLIPRDEADAAQFGGKEGTAVFEQSGTPYIFAQSTFMSPLGVPCQRPPYGTINALDLKTRELVWSKSFGTSAKAGPFNVPTILPIRMGVPNMGGSIVTAGGLTFIGAAQDRKLRAYDTRTGKELWSADLPAVAAATPMSFVSPRDGRQYVVIAAGGHYGIPGPQAAAIMAYALPQE